MAPIWFHPLCPHNLRNVLCFVWFDSVIVVGFDIVINVLHFHLLQNYITNVKQKAQNIQWEGDLSLFMPLHGEVHV